MSGEGGEVLLGRSVIGKGRVSEWLCGHPSTYRRLLVGKRRCNRRGVGLVHDHTPWGEVCPGNTSHRLWASVV